VLPSEAVGDVAGAVRGELARIGLAERVLPGMRVAITAGSRGIADIVLVTRTVVEVVRELGAEPFIVPAMGSHGGATAEGQRQVLADYGITEAAVGAAIQSTMETVTLGQVADGLWVYFDAEAAGADATIVVNRVKAHTAFRGEIESGLCKMTAVGLGKRQGADALHASGLREGIPAAAALTLGAGNVVAGLALVENAAHRLAVVRAARPDEFHDADRVLLRQANEYMPRVPFDHLHVLVVQWMGKDISGSGMDYNVVGMWRRIGGERMPNYERIVVLDLTEESAGNGLGMGIADFTTQRLFDKLDLQKTYMNGLTSNALEAIKIPVVLPDDQSAIGAALNGLGERPRVAVIKSTLDLAEMWVSAALLDEVRRHPNLNQEHVPTTVLFDSQSGRLACGLDAINRALQ
jgi:hypothetical protein